MILQNLKHKMPASFWMVCATFKCWALKFACSMKKKDDDKKLTN
jgi:hypothetical protein